MGLAPAPWAIDGARTGAALARQQAFIATGGAEGVIAAGDLKVTTLDTPGVGVKIAPGGAIMRNRYQAAPTQSYSVMNTGDGEILDVTDMPPVAASPQSHLVCVTVGDKEFSQSAHPWMTSGMPAPGLELDFQYVRFFVIPNVGSGTTKFSQLNRAYPAYALARIDMPANQTTVQSSYIKDLRDLARPRSSEVVFNTDGASDNLLNGAGGVAGAWENWPNTAFVDVEVPDWASVARVSGWVEGAKLTKAGTGRLRIAFANGGAGYVTNIDEAASGIDRRGYNIGGKITVPTGYKGTTQRIRIEGTPTTTAAKGFLTTDAVTGCEIRVRFEEATI